MAFHKKVKNPSFKSSGKETKFGITDNQTYASLLCAEHNVFRVVFYALKVS